MHFLDKKTNGSIPITPVNAETLQDWLKTQDKKTRVWVQSSGFKAATGSILALPDKNGKTTRILFGAGDNKSLYTYADLPAKLPPHKEGYYIDARMSEGRATEAALGWALGCYHFGQYKSGGHKKTFTSLVWPALANKKTVLATAEATFLVRDLVNMPANDMGPDELAAFAKKIVKSFNKASVKIIRGKDLLKKNFPAIYAVGKGSPRPPQIIDIEWGNKKHPQIVLIGKGVCFDTGGLDIKPDTAMLLMKKDMGGAAHALGLAKMIVEHNLPVRLRVLIPAVENAVDGHSYRPGDVISTRKGLTVEVGNTDAEGRIILADALAEAMAGKPDLVIDFATLTGAARVALGPDLPAMFCNNDAIAAQLLDAASEAQDPLWRLPLWQPYKTALESKIADTNNVGGQAGAITAALFLEKFVEPSVPWVHIDTFAWNSSTRPGRPEGGEALGMRASFALIKKRFLDNKP